MTGADKSAMGAIGGGYDGADKSAVGTINRPLQAVHMHQLTAWLEDYQERCLSHGKWKK
jgi:hypothetical protein